MWKPFVIALGAGAVGGWIASMLNLAGTGFGITIIPGTMLLYLNGQLLKYCIYGCIYNCPNFGLTYMFGYEDEASCSSFRGQATAGTLIEEETTGALPASLQDETIISPIVGSAVALADVNDPVFSSGAMGKGIAIKPTEGVVYAPADAEVTIAFATGHAYGLKTANGAEILIHVGIDTVSMNGEGFDQK